MQAQSFKASKKGSKAGRFKALLNSFALTSAVALGGLALCASDADASQWFISGDTIYYTGGTQVEDPATLRRIVADATRQGITIRRVVLRNGPGGFAIGGTGMGTAIRELRLDTVLDGGCYSACTAAYVGGVNRYFTKYDLPVLGPYRVSTFGIHGASASGTPVSADRQQSYINHYRTLLGEEAWAIAGARIIQAHTQLTDSQGFLNYLDPASSNPTTFCPGGNRTRNCTAYPGVTLLSDRIATSPNYFATNDRLVLTNAVSTPFQTGMETTIWYHSAFNFLSDTVFHDQFLGFNRQDRPSVGNRHSTVVVAPGGDWSLNHTITAPFVIVDGGKMSLGPNGLLRDLEGIGVRNGGTLLLTGGNISGPVIADNGGLVTGRGSFGAGGQFDNSDLLAHDIVLRPYTETPLAPNGAFASLRQNPIRLGLGRLTALTNNSNLIFNVTSDQTTAPLRLEQARYFTTLKVTDIKNGMQGTRPVRVIDDYDQLFVAHRKAVLSISDDSNLLLNFVSGHYRPDQRLKLVEGVNDTTALQRPTGICNDPTQPIFCDLLTPARLNLAAENTTFIMGRFTQAGRAGEPDSLIDSSKDGAVIHARHNSLLTFSLFQNENEIYLKANPAFEDVTLFRNKPSGNGLGEALKTASWDQNSRLGPVLGALQFTDRNVARRQASTLRGDGHASLRLVSRSLIDQFSDALVNARQNPVDPVLSNPLVAAEAQSLSGDRQDRMGMGGGLVGGANLMADAPQATPEPRSPFDLNAPTRVFATGFGHLGTLHGQHRISRLDYNGFGALIGASRELNENARLGLAIGYGQTNTNARPANGFSAETDTLLGAVFADISHPRGTLAVQAGYAQITHDTTRTVLDIEGLSTPSTAKYDNHAYFARLEHGLDLGERHGAQVTLLAPVIDYVNLRDARTNERGNSAANLRVKADTLESLRAGLGLHIERRFERGDWGVTPYARAVYQRELWDREANNTHRFRLATNLPFDSVSRELGEDAIEWNLGLRSTTRNQNLNLAVEYQGRAIKGETGHGAQVSVKYSF